MRQCICGKVINCRSSGLCKECREKWGDPSDETNPNQPWLRFYINDLQRENKAERRSRQNESHLSDTQQFINGFN